MNFGIFSIKRNREIAASAFVHLMCKRSNMMDHARNAYIEELVKLGYTHAEAVLETRRWDDAKGLYMLPKEMR
jgi:hypothetical protein